MELTLSKAYVFKDIDWRDFGTILNGSMTALEGVQGMNDENRPERLMLAEGRGTDRLWDLLKATHKYTRALNIVKNISSAALHLALIRNSVSEDSVRKVSKYLIQ